MSALVRRHGVRCRRTWPPGEAAEVSAAKSVYVSRRAYLSNTGTVFDTRGMRRPVMQSSGGVAAKDVRPLRQQYLQRSPRRGPNWAALLFLY